MEDPDYIIPNKKPELPERVQYNTDLTSAWENFEDAFKAVEGAVEERLDSMIPLRALNRELESILKATIKNGGVMTPMQIQSVKNYFGWE